MNNVAVVYRNYAPSRTMNLILDLAERNPHITFVGAELINETRTPRANAMSQQLLFISSNTYRGVEDIIRARIIQRQYHPSFKTFVFLGDCLACIDGFIEIIDFDDLETFKDKITLAQMHVTHQELLSEFESLLEQCDILQDKYRNCEQKFFKLMEQIESELQECNTDISSYDIDFVGTPVPVPKRHIYRDPLTKEVYTSSAERIRWQYELTSLDKIKEWLQLQYYKLYDIQPMHRVYSNGVEPFIPKDVDDIGEYQTAGFLTQLA